MVYASFMPTEDCSNCTSSTKLDCIRDQFASRVAKLLQDTLVEDQVPESITEVDERKLNFPLELADHLLWLAASIYAGEGVKSSEAIYALAKALEELDCDDEPSPDEGEKPRVVPSDVN